jgi:hypothetical protein
MAETNDSTALMEFFPIGHIHLRYFVEPDKLISVLQQLDVFALNFRCRRASFGTRGDCNFRPENKTPLFIAVRHPRQGNSPPTEIAII